VHGRQERSAARVAGPVERRRVTGDALDPREHPGERPARRGDRVGCLERVARAVTDLGDPTGTVGRDPDDARQPRGVELAVVGGREPAPGRREVIIDEVDLAALPVAADRQIDLPPQPPFADAGLRRVARNDLGEQRPTLARSVDGQRQDERAAIEVSGSEREPRQRTGERAALWRAEARRFNQRVLERRRDTGG
jgi:hypothetical protein